MPEIIDPVFAKTSPKRLLCMTENERFGLFFVKTGSINSGTRKRKPESVVINGFYAKTRSCEGGEKVLNT